jgi:hypothetical protein
MVLAAQVEMVAPVVVVDIIKTTVEQESKDKVLLAENLQVLAKVLVVAVQARLEILMVQGMEAMAS